jgi:hypothetical protein
MEAIMKSRNDRMDSRKTPALAALAAVAVAMAGGPALAQGLQFNPQRGNLLVGAGAANYLAQESPSTGLALDARYEYRLQPGLALEGSAATAFSESVDDEGTTVPVILEASLKLRTTAAGATNLFGAAGMGYGAFLDTEDLQDGATFTVPLSVGVEWEGERFGLVPRFTYRPVFGDELGEAEADADMWSAVMDVQLPFL